MDTMDKTFMGLDSSCCFLSLSEFSVFSADSSSSVVAVFSYLNKMVEKYQQFNFNFLEFRFFSLRPGTLKLKVEESQADEKNKDPQSWVQYVDPRFFQGDLLLSRGLVVIVLNKIVRGCSEEGLGDERCKEGAHAESEVDAMHGGPTVPVFPQVQTEDIAT